MKVYALVRRTGGQFQLELGLSPCQPPPPPSPAGEHKHQRACVPHAPSLVGEKAVRGRERGRGKRKKMSIFV